MPCLSHHELRLHPPGRRTDERNCLVAERRGAGDRSCAAYRSRHRRSPAPARSQRRGALSDVSRRRAGARAGARPRTSRDRRHIRLRPPGFRRAGASRVRRDRPVRRPRRAGQQRVELLRDPARHHDGGPMGRPRRHQPQGPLLRHAGRRAVPDHGSRVGGESRGHPWTQPRPGLPRVLLGQGGADHAYPRAGTGARAGGPGQRGRAGNRAVAGGRPRRCGPRESRESRPAAPDPAPPKRSRTRWPGLHSTRRIRPERCWRWTAAVGSRQSSRESRSVDDAARLDERPLVTGRRTFAYVRFAPSPSGSPPRRLATGSDARAHRRYRPYRHFRRPVAPHPGARR